MRVLIILMYLFVRRAVVSDLLDGHVDQPLFIDRRASRFVHSIAFPQVRIETMLYCGQHGRYAAR